ncbi:hypothetical protein [Streptomyces sp. NPDC051211]|uniref:hypothetical protein n=1 Tax=Streptomyces sp. NPDC051211 TaxID=3154643 RepID=UPI00344E3DF7
MGDTERLRAGREGVERLLAGEALEQVLDPADPVAWTALDAGVRALQWWQYEDGGSLGARLRARPETALCHADGRVRQLALAAAQADRRLLPLAVIRCADWAEPVRVRARRILRAALTADPADTLRRLTPLVLRLGGRDHGSWARSLFEESLAAAPDGLLAELRRGPDAQTRRLAGRITLDRGLFDAAELARQATAETDPALQRLWTEAALAALAADGPDDRVVDTLLGARSARVRAAGVTALRRAGRAAEGAAHLGDRSAAVRSCARWLVRQHGGDPRGHYLVELARHPRPGILAGLAECGERQDADVLRELLAHDEGAVRAAAVAGLRALDAARVADVRPLLDDPSPAVAREAVRALRPWADRLAAGALAERLAADRPAHTRRAAFKLLRAQGGMPRLRAAVGLLTDPEPRLRGLAVADVRGWDWQHSLRVEGAGLGELAELLQRSAPAFDDYELALRRSRMGLGSDLGE